MRKFRHTIAAVLAFILAIAPSIAQDVTVTVTPTQSVLPPQVTLYVTEPANYFNVSLSNSGKDAANVYLVLQIEQVSPASTLGVSTPPRRQPPMPIVIPAGGTRILTPGEIRGLFNHIPLKEVQAPAGLFDDYLNGSFGLLPEGQYEAHMTAYNWNPNMSEPVVASSPTGGVCYFTVCYKAQAPEFITPTPGNLLDPLASPISEVDPLAPIFTWKAPVVTCNPALIQYNYSLRIVEVLPGQAPDNSMDMNPVVYQASNLSSAMCLIPMPVIKQMSNKKTYAAQVTATASNTNNRMLNYVSINNNGKSSYCLFRLKGDVANGDEGDTEKEKEEEVTNKEDLKKELGDDEEDGPANNDTEDEDDDISLKFGAVMGGGNITDSLYNFSNPKLREPYFRSDEGARKIYETSDIKVEWLRPRYNGGEGLRNDTIVIEYDVELFNNGERANIEDALKNEPIYKFHTKNFNDTIKWNDIKEKVEVGDYMVLRVNPVVKKGESVSFSGTENIVDFAIAKRLSMAYFQCQSQVTIDNTTPTKKEASDFKDKTVAIGEYRLTIDEIKGSGAEGFTGKGRVEWTPFGASIMVCVKFNKLKINTNDVVYEGTAEAETAPQIATSKQTVDKLFSDWGIDNLIGDSGIPYASQLSNETNGAVKSLAEQVNLSQYYKAIQDASDIGKLITTGKMEKLYMPVRFPNEVLPEGFDVVDIQIAEMKFAPTHATMNIIGVSTMPECDILKDKILVFGAPRVCISPDSFLPEDGHISLLGDFTITPSSDIDITFKAPKDVIEPKDGCFISWHQGKLELLGIDADMKVDGIVKDNNGKPTKEHPIFHLQASFGSWNDFLVDDIAIEDFQVEDLPGYTFSAQNIVYDHSMYRNSQHMAKFPEKYSKRAAGCAGADEEWQGLSIGKVGVAFPKSIQMTTKSEKGDYRLWVETDGVLIDQSGFTLAMGAEKIFQGKESKLGGWGISIDKAKMQIVQDQFDNCTFAGQLNIPVFKPEKKDNKRFGNVDYSCEIRRLSDPRKNKQGQIERTRFSYVFLTEQVNNLDFNFLVAKATLDKDQTYFVMEAVDDENNEDEINTQVELCLGGTIGIGLVDGANDWLKEKTKSLPLDVKIPDIHFTKMRLSNVARGLWTFTDERVKKKINTREETEAAVAEASRLTLVHSNEMKLGDDCYLDLGEWSLASAKKRLGPFSFNIKKFTPSYKNSKIKLEIEGGIGLCEDKINVDGGIVISSKVKTAKEISDYSLEDGDVEFRKLDLDLDFTALHFSGSLEAKKGTDKGYSGKLDISITGMFTVNCEGGYFEHEPDEESKKLMAEEDPESKTFSDDDRKYAWGYFMVNLKSTALRADPVVINRISGGFFFNCRPTKGDDKFTGTPVAQYGMIGVALGVGLSTTAGESALSADLDLLVVYDRKNKCLSTFMFNGKVQAVSGIIKAKASLVYENLKNNAGVTQNRYLVLNVTVEAGFDSANMKSQLDKINAQLASLKGTLDKFQGGIDGVYKQASSSVCGMKGLKDGEDIPDDADAEASADESPKASSGKATTNNSGFVAEKTVISLEFMVTWAKNGTTYKTPKWHLYLGEPEWDKRCSFTLLKFDGKIVKVDIGANGYICLGNELPNGGQLPAIPAEITTFLSGKKSSTTDMDADLGKAERSRAAAAKNLLNPNSCEGGVMVGAAAWGKIEIDLGLLYGKMGAIAGFDAALVNYGNNAFCMNSGSPMGKHGWYAMGQLYAYLYAELGVRIRIGKLINEEYPFFDFGIGGVLEVGLPNPTWVEGKARVKLSLLGGLWKINKKFSFSAGDHCVPFRGNALDGFEMFQGVSHGSDSLYQALMDPTFAISASDANRMTFTTQTSIGSHYRLEDPTAVAEMSEATGAMKDSLGLHASRTYVFDMDQNLNKRNMKMGVRLFDLGTDATTWIKENGEALSENDFYTKMGRKSEIGEYANMNELVASFFDNRGKTVCETSERHMTRELNSQWLGYLHKNDLANRLNQLLDAQTNVGMGIGRTYTGIRSKDEVDVSFREDKGSTFHLSGMNLKPGHSYALFLMADAYEIENGHRVWCTYIDEGKLHNIHWKQTKAWFFRVKSDEEDKVIGDSIRTLEPYVALAYPSIDGTRVRDDRGEGVVPAYFTDIMHPTIALNRDISSALPVSKLKWRLTAVTAEGDTIMQTRDAKYIKENNCINLEPATKFSRMNYFTYKISDAVNANKTYDYSTEQYHLELEYGPISLQYPDEETGEMYETRKLVDLWLTPQPHDVTVKGYDTKQDDSWRQTTTKETPDLLAYSYPFVGATIDKEPVLDYLSGYRYLTDNEIVFQNKKFLATDREGNSVRIPYRLMDPYLYFAYLSKWVFIGDRAISPYAFDDCWVPYGSESLIFTYNGTVVNAEFLKDVKNKSLVDVRKEMYDAWNDWYYNDSNQPKYPLPLTAKSVGGVTVANQDGKCSTITPLNINHYKDMTYCFEDLVQDYIAPTQVASFFSSYLSQATSELTSKFFNHWWNLKHKSDYNFDYWFNRDILQWNKLHRGQYLSYSYRGFEVKVPYYQLPLIYGDCFGDGARYNDTPMSDTNRTFTWSIGENDMSSGDAYTSNLSRRWPSSSSNLLFFRLSNNANGSYKAYGEYPMEMYHGCPSMSYADSYKGSSGAASRQVEYDYFDPYPSLKSVTEFKARIYRVDSYDLTTGLYTLNKRGGGPWEETVTIDASNETAGDLAAMNKAINDKAGYMRTHYDKPRIQVFHTKNGEEQKLKFIYSDSIYTTMTGLKAKWVNETEIEERAWKNADYDITKVEFDKSMKDADLRTTKHWFYGFRELEQVVGAENLNTKNVTDMEGMFYNCPKLTSLDLSTWETENVENMQSMFGGCTSLKTLAQNFNTSKVKSMSCMFQSCTSLTTLNLNNFTSESLEWVSGMFMNCSSLKNLYLKGMDGVKVTEASKMFYGCKSLKNLYINCLTGSDQNITTNAKCKDMFYEVTSSLYSEISFDLIDRIRNQLPGSTKQVYNDNYKVLFALDKDNDGTLIFINNTTDYSTGKTYTIMLNGVSHKMTVKNVWKGKDVMNTGNVAAKIPWNGKGSETQNIYIDRTFTQSPQSTAYWFSGFKNAEAIYGISNLRTHRVTNMAGMFENCAKLTKLNLCPSGSNFQTRNVASMASMFGGCTLLRELTITYMNTAKVTNMSAMFRDCASLTELRTDWDRDGDYDKYCFNTENVTDMSRMFAGCKSLMHFRGESWHEVELDTKKVTDMSYMFHDCEDFEGELGSGLDMSNVTSTENMFYNNRKRESISLVNTGKLYNCTKMFYGCSGIKEINMQSSTFPKVSLATSMFNDVNSEAYIYIPYDANQKVLNQCQGFKNLVLIYPAYVIKYKVGGNYELRFFGSKTNYKVGDKYNGYTIEDIWEGSDVMDVKEEPKWKSQAYNIVNVTIEPSFANVPLANCKAYFRYMEKLASITGLQYMNMKNVKDMEAMFLGCEKLKSLDLSSWNTSSATNMKDMFNGCKELQTLNVSKLNTANVTNMQCMFYGCKSLESLNLKSFSTENVTKMGIMFSGCSSLTDLDLSSFSTPNLKETLWMLNGCSKVKSLKVDNWDFSKQGVLDFSGMESLEELNLLNANTPEMTNFSIADCKSLRKLTLGTRFSVDKLEGNSLAPSFNNVHDLMVICPAASLETIKKVFVDKLGFKVGVTGDFYDKMPDKVAQAIYTSNNATLTFLYGAPVGSSYGGERVTAKWTGDQVLKSTASDAPWSDYYAKVNNVVFEPSFANVYPTSTKAWFKNCQKLEKIEGLKNLNTSKVTNMSYMFYRCSELKELDLSSFNTANVTDMSHMFAQLIVDELDLSKFNTGKVTDMSYMFSINSERTSLDLSNFNTTSVTAANYMFNRCESLKTLRLGQNFTLPRMTEKAGDCFYRVPKTLEVEVHSNYMSSVKAAVKNKLGFIEGTNGEFVEYDKKAAQAIWTSGNSTLTFYYGKQYKTGQTFTNGHKVTSIWSGNDVTNASRSGSKVPWSDTVKDKVTTVRIDKTFAEVKPSHVSYWFAGCQNLKYFYGIEYLNTSNAWSMYRMFYDCGQLTTLDVSGFDTKNVTDMGSVFSGCEKLTELDVTKWNTSKVTSMASMFQKCKSLSSLNPYSWDVGKVTTFSSMFYFCENITSLDLRNWNTVNVTTMAYMFYGCSKLASLNLTNFDTSNVTTMKGMFSYCAITASPYAKFNPKNCTDMSYMFYKCSKMVSFFVDKSFADNTGKVTDMSYMFADCSALRNMSANTLNTTSVTTMAHMFDGCTSNTNLIVVSGWNTANVTDMSYMFHNCGAANITVGKWNTAKVTNMERMFFKCSNVSSLDVSNWKTSNVTSMAYMFSGCSSLTSKIGVSNWNVSKVKSFNSMFEKTALKDIDLSGWNTSACTDYGYMFSQNSSLKKVTLGQSFTPSSSASCYSPFGGVSGCTLNISKNAANAKTVRDRLKFTKSNGTAYYKTSTGSYTEIK